MSAPKSAVPALALVALLLASGCAKKYRCIGINDRMYKDPGDAPPLCETPDGRFYDAVEDYRDGVAP